MVTQWQGSSGDSGVGCRLAPRLAGTAKIETLYSFVGAMLGGKRRGRPPREASPEAAPSSSCELPAGGAAPGGGVRFRV